MAKFNELETTILDYTAGETSLEETNKKLKEIGSTLYLNPMRNMFTADELMHTTVGMTPDKANGWGIMDHGVGAMEKVHIVDGKTVDVNMGEEIAFVYICGKKYRLRGDTLTNA